ncbi:N-acetyl-gamma-glutamyl-phosphate reductase [Solirubrobacter pauli]|uniref:N-acetyl-gamma-glutamyl-phosphate reductase n=1 Tax=Solirubrobacter pauli TaxID=166793 RepID=A0A660L789_9ACTN|nr:N-acetyl-gamma-glutamyl-phosphate reductase [Solirubrobacter pauli]RKQ87813.1 N-acetyl-gamma-glutamyl-phosphate reductase [Solirubrobacter pauli]
MANPKVAVLGAVGYAGAIAAQILYRHPFFELSHVTARAEAGQRLDDVHPKTRVPLELETYAGQTADAAIVAYPHGAAAPVVAQLREAGVRVVDLSADFRLRDRTTYDDWYGEHKAPELFGQGVYGLPELNREAVKGADLVANPGCYPTAALLGLAPLARAGLIGDVIIDGKSGVSGAGRGASPSTHFIAADENVTPYKIEGHRHTPEIEQELSALGNDVTVTFTPYLLPLAQGELVTSYVTPSRDVDAAEIAERFDDLYAAEPFVELRRGPVGVIDVRDTNYARISWHHDPRTGRIIVFAAIDNLWKGAASQAVQNLNLMFGRPETEGLR